MKFLVLSLSTLILTACSGLKTDPERTLASVEEGVPVELLRDLSLATRVITHKTYVYHWLRSDKISLNSKDGIRTDKGPERGREISQKFWSSPTPEYGLVGAGLYMARDAIMSSTYGNVLISVTLPIGTRILDIRDSYDEDYRHGNLVNLSEDTLKVLRDHDCRLEKTAAMNTIFKRPGCTKVFKRAFRDLKIVGNIHHWWGKNRAVCTGEATAFVLWDEELFNSENVRTYQLETVYDLESLKAKDPEAAEEIAYTYALARRSKASDMEDGVPEDIAAAWSTLNVQKTHPEVQDFEKLKEWHKQYTYNCQNAYPEDPLHKYQNLFTGEAIDVSQVLTRFPTVKVLRAVYGENDVTKVSEKHCSRKTTCDYLISKEHLGKPKRRSDKSFQIEWICTDSPDAVQTQNFPGPAEGKSFSMTCLKPTPP